MNLYEMEIKCWRHIHFVWRSFELNENCQKYDWPQFESQWCARNITNIDWNALCCCRDSFAFQFMLFSSPLLLMLWPLLLFTNISLGIAAIRKGTPNPKLCRASFVDLYSFSLDPCHRSMGEMFVVHRFTAKKNIYTWQHVTTTFTCDE